MRRPGYARPIGEEMAEAASLQRAADNNNLPRSLRLGVLVAVLVMLAQGGCSSDLQQHIWHPFRRHDWWRGHADPKGHKQISRQNAMRNNLSPAPWVEFLLPGLSGRGAAGLAAAAAAGNRDDLLGNTLPDVPVYSPATTSRLDSRASDLRYLRSASSGQRPGCASTSCWWGASGYVDRAEDRECARHVSLSVVGVNRSQGTL